MESAFLKFLFCIMVKFFAASFAYILRFGFFGGKFHLVEQIIYVSSGLKLVHFADHLSSDLPGPLNHGI